jgi:hypothetical protein
LCKKVNALKYSKIERISSVMERNIDLAANTKAKAVEEMG